MFFIRRDVKSDSFLLVWHLIRKSDNSERLEAVFFGNLGAEAKAESSDADKGLGGCHPAGGGAIPREGERIMRAQADETPPCPPSQETLSPSQNTLGIHETQSNLQFQKAKLEREETKRIAIQKQRE